MKIDRWGDWPDKHGGYQWSRRLWVGRAQLSITVYKHTRPCVPEMPDRWVIQPSVVYDRKRGSAS